MSCFRADRVTFLMDRLVQAIGGLDEELKARPFESRPRLNDW
jgi:hypothetical protein